MNSLIPRFLTTAGALAVVGMAPAASQMRSSAVPSVGMMKEIPDAGEKPDPQATYRIVFDVQSMPDSASEVSEALQSIGGLVNTYRHYGVPAAHLHTTAVFHGRTILLVTNDAIYSRRTGAASNPNAQLLRELASAGVELVVGGQSALAQHYGPADYLPKVRTNLSATVTFINLQTRGYVKVTE